MIIKTKMFRGYKWREAWLNRRILKWVNKNLKQGQRFDVQYVPAGFRKVNAYVTIIQEAV